VIGRLRSDEGQSLVIVLITLSTIAVMASALMGLASTTAKANQNTAAIVREREAGDAGAEFALQKVKGGTAATYSPSPVPVSLAGPTVNGAGSTVTVMQRSVVSITISGPATLAANTAAVYQAQFSEGPSTFAFPSGVVWSVTPTPGTTLTQDGTFKTTVGATAYTLKAQVANVSATKTVTVP